MKLKAFVIFFTVFTAIAAFSQERPNLLTIYGGAGFCGGSAIAMTGPAAGYYYGGGTTAYNSPEVGSGVSYQAGISYDFILVAGLAITPGINYVHKPFKLTYKKNTASQDLTFESNTDYLEIPLELRYQWTYFFIGAGMYYGIKLKDDTSCSNSSVDLSQGESKNVTGVLFDFGAKINISDSGALVLMMRYEYGFTPAYENSVSLVREVKTDNIQFNLGYAIKM